MKLTYAGSDWHTGGLELAAPSGAQRSSGLSNSSSRLSSVSSSIILPTAPTTNTANTHGRQHYIRLAFFCSLNTKLLRPLGLDSSAAATAEMKSKCKISKNSPKILKSKFQKPVLQFFAYWYTDYLRQVSWELDKNCRSSNMKKFDNIQTPGKSRIL